MQLLPARWLLFFDLSLMLLFVASVAVAPKVDVDNDIVDAVVVVPCKVVMVVKVVSWVVALILFGGFLFVS